MKSKVKTIDINAKEWFDLLNGNSYFSAQITINYGMRSAKTYYLQFQYGYGNSYLYAALEFLKANESTAHIGLNNVLNGLYDIRKKGIIVRYNKIENCKKRDVIAFGFDMAD